MRLIGDMSSIMWTCLQAGKDGEGYTVEHNGRRVQVNTAGYGYENVVNSISALMARYDLTPVDFVMVFEGRDSKKRRCMIDPTYKANREGDKDSRPPEAYVEFNHLKDLVRDTYKNLGAIAVSQPFVEGDDVIAYLVENLEEDCVVQTRDNDLAVLNGVNKYGSKCVVDIDGEPGINKYGPFEYKLITLYKALVGDSSDNVKGVKGFGEKAFMALNVNYDDDGCAELLHLMRQGRRNDVAEIAEENKCKILGKIVEHWSDALKSLKLVELHPEWVNTIKQPLEWDAGMVRKLTTDERLVRWRAQWRVITADNFDAALEFFKEHIANTPFVTFDFETTTPPESDDWLDAKGKKGGVDVLGSEIVSMGVTFGRNTNIGYYISVDHADTNNCTLDQLAQFFEAIPHDKIRVAHNAAGFELVVAYNTWAERWQDNGWRGFIPNVHDSRLAASYWDENQPSHGLKNLSKLILGYEQQTYEQTTTKRGPAGSMRGGTILKVETDEDGQDIEVRQYKMHELTAKEVTEYGLDDVFTTSGLWNYFDLFMQLDHTREAFYRLEQKPTYVSALAYIQGIEVDVPRMVKLTEQDQKQYDQCWATIESYLISKGWEGSTCPVFEELNAANIKQAVEIILGQELKTMVRTPSKLATLVRQMEGGEVLGELIAQNRVDLVNKMIARHYDGKPKFNVGSPQQIAKLLYEVIGMPVRLRNKATEAMRAKGVREGNPRTDDDAINMAIKMGDVGGDEAATLKALLEMKSCNTRSSLYWKAYPTMLHWKTGRLHPELRQSSTNTRRWTSSNPNIQQTEGDPDGVRSTLLAGRGRVFVSLDESSQEVRQVADYSRDENLMGCYVGTSLRDTHSIVGARVAKVTYDEFISMRRSADAAIAKKANDIRKVAKIVLFATLYGAAAAKIGETLGISEVEAQAYIDAIFQEFPKVKAWKEASEDMAQTYGYVTIAGGTKRHLASLVNSQNTYEASKALRQAGNARIQGAGANQIKTVMSRLWDSDLLDSTSLQWKFPCHDEVCFTVAKHDALQVIKTIHGFMTEQFLEVVPSESSVGIGLNYGQLVELEDAFKDAKTSFSDEVVQATIEKLLPSNAVPSTLAT